MTTLLKSVFNKASNLPEYVQDQLANELLEEIEWESKWESTLSESSDVLERLAEQALKEHAAGRTEEMGFDDL